MIKIKKSFKINLSWIFIGNVIHSIFAFLLNIIVARLLSKDDYGIINYVASWISFFNAFAVLGITSVINKYYTEDEKESNEYMCTSILMRIISSIISSILICILIFYIDYNDKKILLVTFIQSFTFISSVGDIYIQWFRYKREANKVAILRLVALFISAIVKLLALIVLKNLYLYVIGIVLETLSFSLLLFIEYKRNYNFKMKVSQEKAKRLIKSSYPFIIASIMTTIYAYTDKIMLQKMMGNEEVAIYSVSVTIAGIIATIASALIEGYRVEIFDLKNKDEILYKRRLRQIYCILFWMCIIYGLFIVFFGKYLLQILYGQKYLSALPSLSVIVWYTAFSYFGSVNNIYMVAEEKEKWVQVNTLIGSICNIVLNLILIPKLGIIGAAVASLITQFVANFIMLYIIKDLRPLTKEIINGIMFKDSINMKELKNKLLNKGDK